mgnify:FL=1
MGIHLIQQTTISKHISSVEHLQVELLMLYGQSCDIGEGKHYTSLTRRGFKRLMKDICDIQHHLKSLRNTYLIDSDGDALISIERKYNNASEGRGD